MPQDTVITQKRRGPAPTGKGQLIGVRLQPEQLAKLDAMRGDQTRPEAIRAILANALS